ncbi:MAG: ATP-binding protein, partial [Chitinophagaceae bacterium]
MTTNEVKTKVHGPSAARMVESLRDTGYVFTTAIADIIDNSVAAGATKIALTLDLQFGENPILTIADNGKGMDETELEAAMTYGSPKRPSPKSLGKFGIGLKTASTSFCRKLTVLSRKDSQYHIRQWDLDTIAREDNWLLLEPDLEQYEEDREFLDSTSADTSTGTLVIWE